MFNQDDMDEEDTQEKEQNVFSVKTFIVLMLDTVSNEMKNMTCLFGAHIKQR